MNSRLLVTKLLAGHLTTALLLGWAAVAGAADADRVENIPHGDRVPAPQADNPADEWREPLRTDFTD